MKNLILFLTVLFAISSCSGSSQDSPYSKFVGEGSFIIKGKVENKPADVDSWRLAVSGYATNEGYTIALEDDGSFDMKIPVHDVQDVYLYLAGDAITIFTYPGDVIELYFDYNDQKETMRLKGRNADREKELALCMQVFKKHRRASSDMHRLMFNREITDEEYLAKLNEYYDSVIETVKTFEEENGSFTFIDKFRDEAYFQTTLIGASKMALLPEIHCEYQNEFSTWVSNNSLDNVTDFPLNNIRFRTNNSYREFVNVFVSKLRPDITSIIDYCRFASSCLAGEPAIRDMHITRRLEMSLTYHKFEEAAIAYSEFKDVCANEEYLAMLEDKYQAGLRIQPGNQAPDFELKDEKGNTVRLSDLRGKIVYMDFWAMGCGPCIYEFQNSLAELKGKYKGSDIAYVYINVNDSDADWKKGIETYNLEGINLIAEGWTDNAACQAYNILGIPHYVLIDKEGIIVNNNCDRPTAILEKGEKSEFDLLVKGKISGSAI